MGHAASPLIGIDLTKPRETIYSWKKAHDPSSTTDTPGSYSAIR